MVREVLHEKSRTYYALRALRDMHARGVRPGEPDRTRFSADKPGQPRKTEAPAGLKWTQCDPGDGSCRTGNAIQVTLPAGKPAEAELADFPPPERSGMP